MKYILENPIIGKIGEEKFKTRVTWRNGELITDEPEKIGGKDLGPDPYTLLLSSFVACTLATLRMYIDHKELHIPEIEVQANLHQRIAGGKTVTHIERSIDFKQSIEPTVLERLLNVAEKCPISKILKGDTEVHTTLR